jgi:hypothetical protein
MSPAQTVVEEIATKALVPTGNFCNPKLPNRQFCANRVLNEDTLPICNHLSDMDGGKVNQLN